MISFFLLNKLYNQVNKLQHGMMARHLFANFFFAQFATLTLKYNKIYSFNLYCIKYITYQI